MKWPKGSTSPTNLRNDIGVIAQLHLEQYELADHPKDIGDRRPFVVLSNLRSNCHSNIFFETQLEENTTAIGYPAHERTHTPLNAERNICEKLGKKGYPRVAGIKADRWSHI